MLIPLKAIVDVAGAMRITTTRLTSDSGVNCDAKYIYTSMGTQRYVRLTRDEKEAVRKHYHLHSKCTHDELAVWAMTNFRLAKNHRA